MSSGTVGMVVSTTSTPTNQPPRPSTTGYRDRSDALALRPKLPRLRTRRHINSSEMSASSGEAHHRAGDALGERRLRHVRA